MSSPNNIPYNSMNMSNNISTGIYNDVPLTRELPKSSFTLWFLFKISLAILLFALLGLNIYTYLKTGKDAITYFFMSNNDEIAEPKKNPLEQNKEIPSTDTIFNSIDLSAKDLSKKEEDEQTYLNKQVESVEKEEKIHRDKADADFFENDGEDVVETNIKEKENKLANIEKEENTAEDEYKVGENYGASSALDLKLVKTPGYCYVGTDRNVRTCLQVGLGDQCMSGKVFPTNELCINPNLKE